MGLEWGGTVSRARLDDVDLCCLFDAQQTSYARDAAKLRAFLEKLRGAYDSLSFLGSSRGAYGALRYADVATDTILAISPLRADVRWRPEDVADDAPTFPPKGAVAAAVAIHVGARNHRDVAVAARIRRDHVPNATVVAVSASAGHGPDLYAPPKQRLDDLVRAAFGRRDGRGSREAD